MERKLPLSQALSHVCQYPIRHTGKYVVERVQLLRNSDEFYGAVVKRQGKFCLPLSVNGMYVVVAIVKFQALS